MTLGATPSQVFIDGIPQLTNPVTVKKTSFQGPPVTPTFDEEMRVAVEYDGLPPLEPIEAVSTIIFRNASSIWLRGSDGAKLVYEALDIEDEGVLVQRHYCVCRITG